MPVCILDMNLLLNEKSQRLGNWFYHRDNKRKIISPSWEVKISVQFHTVHLVTRCRYLNFYIWLCIIKWMWSIICCNCTQVVWNLGKFKYFHVYNFGNVQRKGMRGRGEEGKVGDHSPFNLWLQKLWFPLFEFEHWNPVTLQDTLVRMVITVL